ncbi:hypothetical protein M8C17_01860 [Micromonospora sp. RHAY321]|uniref:hypothetical protein n=1 Tax=Micromonospora sp. RHAY321 TaxID=2944807 RepID=UPI00207C4182|nr:hypothetical protein [Micromonospora sp. RHAY321]MCO1593904.1 hypothetical protein [Micromonospora sp. RHAY321]
MNTTELRVPGIGRWSAEDILRQPIVKKVAGDEDAAFCSPAEAGLRAPGPAEVSLEAYHWGSLSGGKATRTLSLVLLLPFMLSNTAIWMLPPAPATSAALARAICRLLAATLTVMYVLSVVGVAVDLVAWQCAGDPRCTANRWAMSWLADVQPGQRAALAALVPIAAVGAVWWLGRHSWQMPGHASATPAPEGADASRLDAAEFWDNRALLRRLTLLHVAIALGTVDVVLLRVVAPHDGRTLGFGLLALTVIVLGAAVALLCRPEHPHDGADRRIASAVRAVWVAMLAVTASTLGYAALPRSQWHPGAELPGYESLAAWLYVTQAVLMLLLAVIVVRQRSRLTSPAFLGGLGAPVVVAFAVGFGVAFSSALLYAASYHLDRNLEPRPRRLLPTGVPPLLPPVAYRWAALGFFLAVAVTTLAVLLDSQLTLRRRRRSAAEILRRDFPDAPPERQPRVRKTRDAIVRAQLTDRSWPLLSRTPSYSC